MQTFGCKVQEVDFLKFFALPSRKANFQANKFQYVCLY